MKCLIATPCHLSTLRPHSHPLIARVPRHLSGARSAMKDFKHLPGSRFDDVDAEMHILRARIHEVARKQGRPRVLDEEDEEGVPHGAEDVEATRLEGVARRARCGAQAEYVAVVIVEEACAFLRSRPPGVAVGLLLLACLSLPVASFSTLSSLLSFLLLLLSSHH